MMVRRVGFGWRENRVEKGINDIGGVKRFKKIVGRGILDVCELIRWFMNKDRLVFLKRLGEREDKMWEVVKVGVNK